MVTESVVDGADRHETPALRDNWLVVSESLAPLWVVCVGVLSLAVGYLVSPLFIPVFSRAGVWLPYLALGTLFPALLAGVVLAQRAEYKAPAILSLISVSLSCLAVVIFAGPVHAFIAMGLAQIQTAICAVMLRRVTVARPPDLLTLLVFSFFAWVACLELFTWAGMETRLAPSWPLLAIGVIVSTSTCWWMFGEAGVRSNTGSWGVRLLDIVSCAAITAAAFRTDGLFVSDQLGEDGTFHHWGAFVGAAEAVRQGGWLLWDVPSLYGFLSTLVLAAIPTPSTWQALYLANGLLTALLGIWIYARLKAVHASPFGSVFALVSVLVVVFLSVYPPLLSPQHYFPQAGAFRFVWCYVLIGVLAWESTQRPGSSNQRLALLVGTLCWTLSTAWSAESAVYGTVIWIPAFGLVIFRDHLMAQASRNWRAALGWTLFPLILLTVLSAVIVLFYRRILGHGPDARAYVEVVLAFSNTTVSDITGLYDPMSFARTIAVGVLVVVMLAVVAVAFATNQGGLRYLPLACGSAFGVWALLSYPVGEVFQFAIYRIVPFMILVMAVLLSVALSDLDFRDAQRWSDAFKVTVITILTALLTTTIANASELGGYIRTIRTEPFIGRDVTVGLPLVDPSLESLLVDAKLSGDDPIFYAGSDYGNLMSGWTPAGASEPVTESQQWLTGQPLTMVFLSDLRKQVYMARDAQRHPEDGWLIERRDANSVVFGIGDWFFQQVSTSHVPAGIAENENWRITRYEPVSAAAAIDGATRIPEGHPTLSAEFLINGTPLAGSVFPEIWGYFGPEWTSLATDQAGKCAPGQGTLYVYTPEPLNASLAIGFLRESEPVILNVSVNGGGAVPTQPTRNRKMTAELTLNAGWNEVVVAHSEPSPADAVPMMIITGCQLEKGEQEELGIKSVDLRFR